MNEYTKGAKVRCKGKFYLDGALTDPSGVLFKFQNPAGTETTYTYGVDGALVKDSTGIYHVDLSVTTKGVWAYRWESTGAAQSANEGEFYVRKSEFT